MKKGTMYRGLWKILNAQGRFISWATGTVNDAVLQAEACGVTDGELIPWEER